MFNATRHLPLVFAGLVLVSAPACATAYPYPQRYPVVDRDDRAYYDRGFHEGRESGEDDARHGRSYEVGRHREFRDNRRGDDRGDLRAFREGFQAGYDEGYRRYARGRYDDRRAYPPVQPGVRYPDYDRDGRYDRDDRDGRFGSHAAQIGYRDGLDEGQNAARHGDRFDPVREKRYREADHDYDRRDGSRDEYAREYRAAFQQGYEAGYRGVRP